MSLAQRLPLRHGMSGFGAHATPVRLLVLACVLLLPVGGDTSWTWWQAVVLLFIAPLAEEVVFRLGLHQSLLQRNVPPWAANLLVAMSFGVAHWLVRGEVTGMLVVAPALIIGVAFERERRLAPCVCLHALMNLVWLRLV